MDYGYVLHPTTGFDDALITYREACERTKVALHALMNLAPDYGSPEYEANVAAYKAATEQLEAAQASLCDEVEVMVRSSRYDPTPVDRYPWQ